MILLIDNYDSFVYNLSRYLEELGCPTQVVRNDRISVDEVRALRPEAVVLSPGPGTPQQAGICIELVRALSSSIPILGVCLGHQAIAEAYGASVVRAQEPVHGRTSLIHHQGTRLFAGLPNPFTATRYHSLVVVEATLPNCLVISARTDDGVPMAVEHGTRPVMGVQFHPESVLTQSGHRLLANFLEIAGVRTAALPTGDLIAAADDDWFTQEPTGALPWHGARISDG